MGIRKKNKAPKIDLVAEFMKLPDSDNTMFLSPPSSISDVIEKIWDEWSIGTKNSPEQVISQEWNKVVGTKLSSRCAPEKLSSNGTLFLRAANGPVKQELSFIKKKIISRISRLDGCAFVRDIKIT